MPDPADAAVVEATALEREWAQTAVTAETPAARVRITMFGDYELRVWIDHAWYAAAPRSELQDELVRAARLTYVARTRAYYETWSRISGMQMSPVTTPVSAEQEAFARALEDISAHGESDDGAVTVSIVGLSHFAVSLAAGAHERLDAGQLAECCQQAGLACLRDHEQAWQRAHFDVYTRPRLERTGLL